VIRIEAMLQPQHEHQQGEREAIGGKIRHRHLSGWRV
jgi:hypothetical protein